MTTVGDVKTDVMRATGQAPWQHINPIAGLVGGLWRSPLRLVSKSGATADQAALARRFISGPFGGAREHRGVDFPVPEGTPIYASIEGRVVKSGADSTGRGGLGIIVEKDLYPWLYQSAVWHLKELVAREGQEISPGDLLGYSGATGSPITGPHLHWQTRARFPLTGPESAPISMTWGELRPGALQALPPGVDPASVTVPAWETLNRYFVGLSDERPGDDAVIDHWATWLKTGNHQATSRWLEAQNPPPIFPMNKAAYDAKRKAAQVAEEAGEALSDAAKKAGRAVSTALPWGWIVGGVLGVGLVYGVATAYAQGAGARR